MFPKVLPPAPGCLVREIGPFNDTANSYDITLWANQQLYFCRWVGAAPPSLSALLENLAAFPFAWTGSQPNS